jgi:hypothetical protein
MKKILNFIYFCVRQIYVSRIIKQFDKKNHNLVSSKFEGHQYFSKIFEPLEVNWPERLDKFGMATKRSINKIEANYIKVCLNKVEKDIKAYLGEGARIDDIYVNYFDPNCCLEEPSPSGSWHHDNVGHRLKMYICLLGDGKTPTIILKDSHKSFKPFKLKEAFRFLGKVDVESFSGEELALSYKTGDMALFDTNAYHRGHYEGHFSKRVVLVVEFIDREKSNRLSGLCACGPGSKPDGEVTLSTEALEVIKSDLIDWQLIAKKEDEFSYSLKHLKNHH